ENELRGEGVGAHVEMRDGVGAGEEGAADFAAGGNAVGVEDAGTAVGGFTGEGELGAGAIKFGAPFDDLSDVLGAFFDEESDGVGAAQAVAGVEGVLFVEADFVYVAESDGDAALGVSGGGFGKIGLGEDQDGAGLAELDGGAHARDSGTDDEVIGLVGFGGVGHGSLREAQKYGSTREKSSQFSVVSFEFRRREEKKERMKEGKKERRKEGKKERRKEVKKERRKEGKKDGNTEVTEERTQRARRIGKERKRRGVETSDHESPPFEAEG